MKPVSYGDYAITADRLCADIRQTENNYPRLCREFITLYESTLKTDCASICMHRTVPVSVSYRYRCHPVLCFYESKECMDIASVLSAHTLAVS